MTPIMEKTPPSTPSKIETTPRAQLDLLPILEADMQMGQEAILESQGEPPRLSKVRMVILAAGMMMTYFVGVCTAHRTKLIDVDRFDSIGDTAYTIYGSGSRRDGITGPMGLFGVYFGFCLRSALLGTTGRYFREEEIVHAGFEYIRGIRYTYWCTQSKP